MGKVWYNVHFLTSEQPMQSRFKNPRLALLQQQLPTVVANIVEEYSGLLYEIYIKNYSEEADLACFIKAKKLRDRFVSRISSEVIDLALYALEQGYIKTIKFLLKYYPVLLGPISPSSVWVNSSLAKKVETTLLIKAIVHKQRGMTLMLLEQYPLARANINFVEKRTYFGDVEYGETALTLAKQIQDEEMVKELLSYGAKEMPVWEAGKKLWQAACSFFSVYEPKTRQDKLPSRPLLKLHC